MPHEKLTPQERAMLKKMLEVTDEELHQALLAESEGDLDAFAGEGEGPALAPLSDEERQIWLTDFPEASETTARKAAARARLLGTDFREELAALVEGDGAAGVTLSSDELILADALKIPASILRATKRETGAAGAALIENVAARMGIVTDPAQLGQLLLNEALRREDITAAEFQEAIRLRDTLGVTLTPGHVQAARLYKVPLEGYARALQKGATEGDIQDIVGTLGYSIEDIIRYLPQGLTGADFRQAKLSGQSLEQVLRERKLELARTQIEESITTEAPLWLLRAKEGLTADQGEMIDAAAREALAEYRAEALRAAGQGQPLPRLGDYLEAGKLLDRYLQSPAGQAELAAEREAHQRAVARTYAPSIAYRGRGRGVSPRAATLQEGPFAGPLTPAPVGLGPTQSLLLQRQLEKRGLVAPRQGRAAAPPGALGTQPVAGGPERELRQAAPPTGQGEARPEAEIFRELGRSYSLRGGLAVAPPETRQAIEAEKLEKKKRRFVGLTI